MQQHLPGHRKIAAVLPYYDGSGDSTKIFLKSGGSQILNLRIRSVISRLARENATDLQALKAKVTKVTQSSHQHILPFAPGLVLIPVKVRKPRISGDPANGYINYHAVKTVSACKRQDFKSVIQLEGGAAIESLWSAKTVEKYLRLARLTLSHGAPTEPAGDIELASAFKKLIEVCHVILSLKTRY